MQFVFVSAFDPQFADQCRAGIRLRIDALEVLLADGRDVAERVHGHRSERIVSREPGANVHAREFVAMHREARHLLVVELQFDRDAFIDVMRQDGAPDAAHILAVEQTDGHQTPQSGVQLGHAAHLLAHQFELKGR